MILPDLKSDGANVTGTMTNAGDKPRPVAKGSLDGDKISLTIPSEWEGNPITLVVTGAVSGDTMTLKIRTDDGALGHGRRSQAFDLDLAARATTRAGSSRCFGS